MPRVTRGSACFCTDFMHLMHNLTIHVIVVIHPALLPVSCTQSQSPITWNCRITSYIVVCRLTGNSPFTNVPRFSSSVEPKCHFNSVGANGETHCAVSATRFYDRDTGHCLLAIDPSLRATRLNARAAPTAFPEGATLWSTICIFCHI